jgi:hypothetical protein
MIKESLDKFLYLIDDLYIIPWLRENDPNLIGNYFAFTKTPECKFHHHN